MPNEKTPFLEEIQAGYAAKVKDPEAARRVFELVQDEAKALMEAGDQADQVSNAARDAIREVLKGERIWSAVLEAVKKKLGAGSGNIAPLREVVALQRYVVESLPVLSQSKLEQTGEQGLAKIESSAIVAEIHAMAMQAVAGKLTETPLLDRTSFIVAWTSEIASIRKRLGVAENGVLARAIDASTKSDNPEGVDALRSVNKKYSEARIDRYVMQYRDEASKDTEGVDAKLTPQGELYRSFLHQQLEAFDSGLSRHANINVTGTEEQFLLDLFSGLAAREGSLSNKLSRTAENSRVNVASGDAARMIIEGGSLSDYLTALDQMDHAHRQLAFQTACEAWRKLPVSTERKVAMAKMILVAHDAEIDDDTNYSISQELRRSINVGDLDSLRREAKKDITRQAMDELRAGIFASDVDSRDGRVNVQELTQQILTKEAYERRRAMVALAKQEIYQRVVAEMIEKSMPTDVTEASQHITDARIALLGSGGLVYKDDGSKSGFSPQRELGGSQDNQAVERHKSMLFLASFAKALLRSWNDQFEQVKLVHKYFTEASQFGVSIEQLLDLHNRIAAEVIAVNQKIEEISPSGRDEQPPIQFTDCLPYLQKLNPPVDLMRFASVQAKGFKVIESNGNGYAQRNNYLQLYATDEELISDVYLGNYQRDDVLRAAQSSANESAVIAIAKVGDQLQQVDRSLTQHENVMKPGHLASYYEQQTFHDAGKYDSEIRRSQLVSDQYTAAENLMRPNQDAIRKAMEEFRKAGEESDKVASDLYSWQWQAERDYIELGAIEKGKIKLGGGSSEFAKKKKEFEAHARNFDIDGKFDLTTREGVLEMAKAFRRESKADREKKAKVVVAEIQKIKGSITTQETIAQQLMKSVVVEASGTNGKKKLKIPDYSGGYGRPTEVDVQDLDTIARDPRLQTLYRTFMLACQGYANKVNELAQNYTTNNGAYHDEAALIFDAVGELRLALGFKEARESMYGDKSATVDMSLLTQKLEPMLRQAYAERTKGMQIEVDEASVAQLPGDGESIKRLVAERVTSLQQRRAKLSEMPLAA